MLPQKRDGNMAGESRVSGEVVKAGRHRGEAAGRLVQACECG